MDYTIFANSEPIEIGKDELEKLRILARKSPNMRARYCLHKDHQDKIQEMIIAVCTESYICPHRQINKKKSYITFEGEMVIAFFNECGKVTEKFKMGSPDKDYPFIYRFSGDRWHTVVSLSEIAIYLETIQGPFRKGDTEFAIWGPNENNKREVRNYIEMIKK